MRSYEKEGRNDKSRSRKSAKVYDSGQKQMVSAGGKKEHFQVV